MFEVNPNTVYTANDLVEISEYAKSTVYGWFKTGLKHFNAPGGKSTTGRAVLDYFEQSQSKDDEDVNDQEELPAKVMQRMEKAGIRVC